MTSPQPTIEIPRLEDESVRAYAARVEYLTMGAGRSLEKVINRAQTAPKPRPTIRIATLKQWSSRYAWQRHAEQYDQTLATLAAQAHAEEYRHDLEDHRQRYQKAGRELYTVASALIRVCAEALRGKTVEGKDGKTYTIPAMEITPNTLSIAARALTAAGDLEAHALRVADLLPRLSDDSQ